MNTKQKILDEAEKITNNLHVFTISNYSILLCRHNTYYVAIIRYMYGFRHIFHENNVTERGVVV